MLVEAGVEGPRPIVRLPVTRHGDQHRCVAQLGAHPPGQLIAVEAGQPDVDERDVRRPGQDTRQPLRAVAGAFGRDGGDAVRPSSQIRARHGLGHGLVVEPLVLVPGDLLAGVGRVVDHDPAVDVALEDLGDRLDGFVVDPGRDLDPAHGRDLTRRPARP